MDIDEKEIESNPLHINLPDTGGDKLKGLMKNFITQKVQKYQISDRENEISKLTGVKLKDPLV